MCATSEPEQMVIRSSRYNKGTFDYDTLKEDYQTTYDQALEAFYSTIYTSSGVDEANLVTATATLNMYSRDLSIWSEDEDVLAIEQAACIADTTTCFTDAPDANSTVFLAQLATEIETLDA